MNQAPPSPDHLIRPRDAARLLSVSRSTIYRWFWEGRLAGVKLVPEKKGTVRILDSSVRDMLNEAS